MLVAKDYHLNKKIVETQFPLLVNFARSLAAYRAIFNDFARIERNQIFWIQTADLNFLNAVTIWCMIFGANNNETHWKNTPRNNIDKFRQEFRTLVCTASGLTDAEWKKYHEEMRNFRDTFISHRNISLQGNIPDLTAAYKIADAYFEYLKCQLPGSNQPNPISSYFADCQIEVLLVLKNDFMAV
jgi:hypothetical protein